MKPIIQTYRHDLARPQRCLQREAIGEGRLTDERSSRLPGLHEVSDIPATPKGKRSVRCDLDELPASTSSHDSDAHLSQPPGRRA